MQTQNKNRQSFSPNTHYHIFNRGNNKEPIFYTDKNYKYFLKKFDQYLARHLETFAYSLIPNQFHFLIKTTANTDHLSNQFRKFFITYSQAINSQEERSGSLFLKPFRRKAINDSFYLKRVIFYIHNNPVCHGLVNTWAEYKYSSFNSILSNSKTQLKRCELIKLFSGIEGFIEFHKSMKKVSEEMKWFINY